MLAGLAVVQGCLPTAPREPSTPPDAQIVTRGAQVYAARCQSCHGDGAGRGRQPGVPTHGPEGHTWHHSDRDLRTTIEEGSDSPTSRMMRDMMGPPDAPRMPGWKGVLSDEDIDAVIAYIKTFWTPEQRRWQAERPMMP